MRKIFLGIAAAALAANPVLAQPATTWTVTSGIEQFAFRDIARGHPPVDASPLAWQGAGPAFHVARTRVAGPRWRQLEIVVSDARDFSYRSGQREFAADPGDGAFHLEGRYGYHRDVLTRRLPAWLRTSIGARGSGAWLSLTHRVPPANDLSLSSADAGIAFVLAAAIAPSKRVSGDVNYTNGLRIGRTSPRGAVGETAAWAGGWTTDLVLTGRVRLSPRYSLVARFIDRGDGLESSHRAYTTERRQFSAGVAYAR